MVHPTRRMGRFDHRATGPVRGPSDIFRWKVLDPLRGRTHRSTHANGPTPVRANDGSAMRDLPASLTWVGHASFVMRLGGRYVAHRPRLVRAHPGGDPAAGAAGRGPRPSTPPIDVVLVSHNHYDHLDLPTLKRIGPRREIRCALGNARDAEERRAHRRGGARLVGDAPRGRRGGDARPRAPLVDARPVGPQRRPLGRLGPARPGGVAYHSGDTAYFDGFAEIGARCGPIDWAMLPVGAYEPRWFMEPQHMNPDDALAAFEALARARSSRCTGAPSSSPTSPLRAARAHPRGLRRAGVGPVTAVGDGRGRDPRAAVGAPTPPAPRSPTG
jgi:hypothetical protein